jgi:hypothetical protein
MTVINELNTTTLGNDVGGRAIRIAVLDDAHLGDIHGALGSIAEDDHAPRLTLRARVKTLVAILGPGLIVMVGDNAPSIRDPTPGRPELRHDAALDAGAAGPGSLRQSGNGTSSRRGHHLGHAN